MSFILYRQIECCSEVLLALFRFESCLVRNVAVALINKFHSHRLRQCVGFETLLVFIEDIAVILKAYFPVRNGKQQD